MLRPQPLLSVTGRSSTNKVNVGHDLIYLGARLYRKTDRFSPTIKVLAYGVRRYQWKLQLTICTTVPVVEGNGPPGEVGPGRPSHFHKLIWGVQIDIEHAYSMVESTWLFYSTGAYCVLPCAGYELTYAL